MLRSASQFVCSARLSRWRACRCWCPILRVAQATRCGAIGRSAVDAATGSVQPAPVTRHWRNEWFRDRDYFDPLIAEPRAPQIAFTFPAWIPELEFSVEPGNRLAWEVSLGREIPIFTRANFDDATRGSRDRRALACGSMSASTCSKTWARTRRIRSSILTIASAWRS